MSGVTFKYMDDYLRSLITNEEVSLVELEKYAEENNVPIIHKEVGKFLQVIINIKRPLKILELGTAIGYSAILMHMASGKQATVVSIERDEKMYLKALSNIQKYGFEDKIKCIQGDCLEVLKTLDEEFDIIFMDAGKGHYSEFFKECKRLMDKDGIIISDNVLFRGMVASEELVIRRKITIVKRMRKFLKELSSNDEFITSIIPMSDGVALTTRRKNDE